MKTKFLFLALVPFGLFGCVTQKDYQALSSDHAALATKVDAQREELAKLKSELEATRERLDNALRANAESGQDLVASQRRVNELTGKVDELTHTIDEGKKELSASRAEIYARLDDLKRAAPAPAPPAPPAVTIPSEKPGHYAALEAAYQKKDWVTVRALGPEYVNRYPTDDLADDALYMVASADLQDGRASSALGSHNRLLKLFPKTNVLDKTLYDMGEAYLALKDCANAKLAYQACESRFAKEKIGQEAKKKLDLIAKAPPGTCAP